LTTALCACRTFLLRFYTRLAFPAHSTGLPAARLTPPLRALRAPHHASTLACLWTPRAYLLHPHHAYRQGRQKTRALCGTPACQNPRTDKTYVYALQAWRYFCAWWAPLLPSDRRSLAGMATRAVTITGWRCRLPRCFHTWCAMAAATPFLPPDRADRRHRHRISDIAAGTVPPVRWRRRLAYDRTSSQLAAGLDAVEPRCVRWALPRHTTRC